MCDGEIKYISVYCDYAADGIWVNGCASDIKMLVRDLNLDVDVSDLYDEFYNWQLQFESFNLYDPALDIDAFEKTEKFQEFEKKGKELAFKVRKLVPEKYPVYYFEETRPYQRYEVKINGEFIPVDKHPYEIYQEKK
jgi:hypothetical protein